MENIIKNKLTIGLMTSVLVSLAFCSASYAATITTYNASSISATSANLDCLVDVTTSSAMVWFEYGQNGNLGNATSKSTIGVQYAPQQCSKIGNSDTLILANLTPNTSYSFRAVAQNVSGTTTQPVYGSTLPFTTSSGQNTNQNNYGSNGAPTVTTNSAAVSSGSVILDAFVTPNGVNTTAWFEYASGSNGYDVVYNDLGVGKEASQRYISTNGANQADFQYSLPNPKPGELYYYRVVAQNNNGTTQGTIMSLKTATVDNGLAYGKPIVITDSAMLVRETSGMINGTITPNNLATSAWFELSQDPKLESGTIKIEPTSVGAGNEEVPIYSIRADLKPNTKYYFRAVAQNSFGSAVYGTINSFTTKAVSTVVTNNNTATSTVSVSNNSTSINNLIYLSAEFNNSNPRPGKEIIYAINYENTSNSDLTNAILKVTLPNEAAYKDSSFANVSQDGNILSFKIGSVATKASGIVSIKIKIMDLAKVESLKFNDSISYSVNGKVGNGSLTSELKLNFNSLTASAIDLLENALDNMLFVLLLGGLIGFGVYHFFVVKRQDSDSEIDDPLK